jgi:hypothetical protein
LLEAFEECVLEGAEILACDVVLTWMGGRVRRSRCSREHQL